MKNRILGIAMCVFVLAGAVKVVQAGPTLALTLMTNMAKITAANASSVATASTNVRAGTNYGGTLNLDLATKLSVANFGSGHWIFSVTNFGNATANFSAKVVASNVRPGTVGGTGWARYFLTGFPIVVSPGAVGQFHFVITNTVAASNGSYMSYLVKATNNSAQVAARTYKGADGSSWFGGLLGVNTNHASTNVATSGSTIGPVVYLQHATSGSTNLAGFVTVVVSGPVLVITKTIRNINNPSGLAVAQGYVVPGSYIDYQITVTNKGSAAATAVRILDNFSTNMAYVSSTNGGGFSYLATTLAGSMYVTRFSNNSFAPGNATIRIVVKVK